MSLARSVSLEKQTFMLKKNRLHHSSHLTVATMRILMSSAQSQMVSTKLKQWREREKRRTVYRSLAFCLQRMHCERPIQVKMKV